MMRKKIDIRKWERREIFEFFRDYDEPYYGISTDLDCTAAYQFAKYRGISFFLYYLVTGLVEYIRTATLDVWVSALPGLVVVLALFLLFAVPAWIAVAGRTRVVVDLQSGRVLDVRDLRVYRRATSVPIDSVLGVSVSRQRRSFRIQIDLAGRKPITVGFEPSGSDARDVAERLAGYLRTEVSS